MLVEPSGLSTVARLAEMDRLVVERLAGAVRRKATVAVLRGVSRCGDWALSVVTILLLAGVGSGHGALRLLGASLLGLAVQRSLKHRFRRRRPCRLLDGPPQRAPVPDEGSFPSGHTLHAVLAMVMVSVFLPPLSPLYALLACLMAISRVALGVHFASDVAAGAALGMLLGFLSLMP